MSGFPRNVVTAAAIAAAGAELTANKNAANGYAGLGADTLLLPARMNAVGAQCRNNAAQAIVTGTNTPLALQVEDFDTDGFHDPVTNNSRFTIPAGLGGFYMLAGLIWYTGGAGTQRQAFWFKNGAQVNDIIAMQAVAAGNFSYPTPLVLVSLAAGDYVELGTFHNAGVNVNVNADSVGSIAFLGN